MDSQLLINTSIGFGFAALGWFGRELWSAVQDLRQDLHEIEIDLPRNYVRREEFSDSIKEIKDICHQIFNKIDALNDRKADKV